MLAFVIAIAAGALSPKIEDIAARPLARAVSGSIEIQDNELAVLSFMIGMLVAALVAAIVGSGSALGVMVGGVLGYFGLRIVAAIKRVIDGPQG